MPYYSEDVVEEVRSRTDIVDVISKYVNLQKKGSQYFGLCPFHNEKTGSFSVSPQKQMYYCFGCGKGGNVFSFLMDYDNMTFKEAVEELSAIVPIAIVTNGIPYVQHGRFDRSCLRPFIKELVISGEEAAVHDGFPVLTVRSPPVGGEIIVGGSNVFFSVCGDFSARLECAGAFREQDGDVRVFGVEPVDLAVLVVEPDDVEDVAGTLG